MTDGQQLNSRDVADALSNANEGTPSVDASYDVSHVVVPVPTNGLLTQLLAENGTSLADLEQSMSSSDDKVIETIESSAAKPLGEAAAEMNDIADCNSSGRLHPSSAAVAVSDACGGNSSELVLTEDGKRLFDITIVKGSVGLGFCIEGGVGSPTGDRPISVKRLFRSKLTLLRCQCRMSNDQEYWPVRRTPAAQQVITDKRRLRGSYLIFPEKHDQCTEHLVTQFAILLKTGACVKWSYKH